MFGFKVTNKKGQEIILGQEQSYLLYKSGVITRYFNAFPDGNELNYNMGELYRWMAPILFISIERKLIYCWCGLRPGMDKYGTITSEKLRLWISGYAVRQSQHMKVSYYIFVPAKYIPLPDYGLVLYNDKNEVAFHNGAKPLTIKGIRKANSTVGWGGLPAHDGVNYYRDDNVYAYRSSYNYCVGWNSSLGGSNGYIHQNILQSNQVPYILKSDY